MRKLSPYSLTGSIGFWLTLAMMVGWSLRRGEGGAKSDRAPAAVQGTRAH
jgi:hypothetical protein